jgi:hypothetical protein
LGYLHLVDDRWHLPDLRGGAFSRLERQHDQRANLVFSFSAAAAAAYAVLDMVVLRAQTPAECGELWRWALAEESTRHAI